MSKTTAQLRESVAKKLRVMSVSEPLSDDDADVIDSRIQDVSDYLREKGLAWWVDNSIPNAVIMPMTLMVSAWSCADFGKAGQGYESGFSDGESQLGTLKPSAVIQTTRAQYF